MLDEMNEREGVRDFNALELKKMMKNKTTRKKHSIEINFKSLDSSARVMSNLELFFSLNIIYLNLDGYLQTKTVYTQPKKNGKKCFSQLH